MLLARNGLDSVVPCKGARVEYVKMKRSTIKLSENPRDSPYSATRSGNISSQYSGNNSVEIKALGLPDSPESSVRTMEAGRTVAGVGAELSKAGAVQYHDPC